LTLCTIAPVGAFLRAREGERTGSGRRWLWSCFKWAEDL